MPRAPFRLVSIFVAAALLPELLAADGSSLRVPEGPETPIVTAPFPGPPPSPPAVLPAEIAARRNALTLGDVLDVALRRDPATRAAWESARAAAEELRSRKSAYYPEVDAVASVSRAKVAGFGGRVSNLGSSYGPQLTVDWLLFDFGNRAGDVEEGRRLAFSSIWAHGAAVQDTILRVTIAYYGYLDAKAQLDAARRSEVEAETNRKAAEDRRSAGVATIADVLQARTALSQATLDRITVEGNIHTVRGALATAVGVPANTPFDAAPLPDSVPAAEAGREVDALIDEALSRRPDLAAAREDWLAAEANVRKVRGEGLPSLGFTGSAGRTWYDPATVSNAASTWSLALTLRVPLFTGFRNAADLAKARAESGAAAEAARDVENRVVLDVWTAYYALRTAAQRVETSRDLLESATQSEEVALGRYKEGVGTILDLLNAQAALASARAQEISSRAAWLVASARLALAVGELKLPS